MSSTTRPMARPPRIAMVSWPPCVPLRFAELAGFGRLAGFALIATVAPPAARAALGFPVGVGVLGAVLAGTLGGGVGMVAVSNIQARRGPTEVFMEDHR